MSAGAPRPDGGALCTVTTSAERFPRPRPGTPRPGRPGPGRPTSARALRAAARSPCACTTPRCFPSPAPVARSRRSRSTAATSRALGRSPNSTGENVTPSSAPNPKAASAEDGPSTDTPTPRPDRPAASIRTCAPVPPAVVPTTSATRPGLGGTGPAGAGLAWPGTETGQGGAQVAAVEAASDAGEDHDDHDGDQHRCPDVDDKSRCRQRRGQQ